MKRLSVLLVLMFFAVSGFAQGLKIGDVAPDFRLMNVDGRYVSMADYPDAKGFIVIFSSNHCPFVVAVEDRMIALHHEFKPKGFPLIAIMPNDPVVEPRDSFELMQVRAREKGFPFPYVFDKGQKIFPQYGATHTPHVYLLERVGNELRVAYIGAIDNNVRDASLVTERYLANAINALLEGRRPNPEVTRAIGCTIKVRRAE